MLAVCKLAQWNSQKQPQDKHVLLKQLPGNPPEIAATNCNETSEEQHTKSQLLITVDQITSIVSAITIAKSTSKELFDLKNNFLSVPRALFSVSAKFCCIGEWGTGTNWNHRKLTLQLPLQLRIEELNMAMCSASLFKMRYFPGILCIDFTQERQNGKVSSKVS